MALRDYILGIMSVPLASPSLTKELTDRESTTRESLSSWLLRLPSHYPALELCLVPGRGNDWVTIELAAPHRGSVGFKVVGELEHASCLLTKSTDSGPLDLDLMVIILSADVTKPGVARLVGACHRAAGEQGEGVLVMEPEWTAGALIEDRVPLLTECEG